MSVDSIIVRTCHLCGKRHEGKTDALPEGWQHLKGFREQNVGGKTEEQHFAVNVCDGCADYRKEGVFTILKSWVRSPVGRGKRE